MDVDTIVDSQLSVSPWLWVETSDEMDTDPDMMDVVVSGWNSDSDMTDVSNDASQELPQPGADVSNDASQELPQPDSLSEWMHRIFPWHYLSAQDGQHHLGPLSQTQPCLFPAMDRPDSSLLPIDELVGADSSLPPIDELVGVDSQEESSGTEVESSRTTYTIPPADIPAAVWVQEFQRARELGGYISPPIDACRRAPAAPYFISCDTSGPSLRGRTPRRRHSAYDASLCSRIIPSVSPPSVSNSEARHLNLLERESEAERKILAKKRRDQERLANPSLFYSRSCYRAPSPTPSSSSIASNSSGSSSRSWGSGSSAPGSEVDDDDVISEYSNSSDYFESSSSGSYDSSRDSYGLGPRLSTPPSRTERFARMKRHQLQSVRNGFFTKVKSAVTHLWA